MRLRSYCCMSESVKSPIGFSDNIDAGYCLDATEDISAGSARADDSFLGTNQSLIYR